MVRPEAGVSATAAESGCIQYLAACINAAMAIVKIHLFAGLNVKPSSGEERQPAVILDDKSGNKLKW